MESKIRNEKVRRRLARRDRVSKKTARASQPRLTVFRSAKHIYAQLIDPEGRTVGTVSTRSKELRDAGYGGNIDAAKRVGQKVAELAKSKQIQKVVFNRNGFLYHGRVKALAEAAREAGLEF
jgi:large subunit ribosomal protein L18